MKYWIFSRALSVHKCCFYLHSRWRNRRCWVSTPPTPQRRSSQPVAQETDGMQLQVDAEVGVDAILPPDLKITCRHQTKDSSAGSQKKKKPYRTAGWTIAPLSVVVPSRPVWFFLQYVILSLRLPVSIPSLPRSPVFLPVFGVIMLLSRSLLSECSLAELIFGWCYITAPPSHLGADLLRSQDKQAVKWKPEKTLWIHFTEFAALFPYISR